MPQRPHFDYQPPESTNAGSETGSFYGDDDEHASWDANSDIGSLASERRRPKPVPYEVDDIPILEATQPSLPPSAEQQDISRSRVNGNSRDPGGNRGRGGRGRGGRDRGNRDRGGRGERWW